ncbi:MAG: hypothetical protein VCC00_13210 [Deltaproteobacteria bacterium]
MKIPSFHTPAQQARLAFFVAFTLAASSLPAAANRLENPADGATYSGIGLFSGFHCGTNNLSIVVDEDTAKEQILRPSYGTERNDTIIECGHADTGFGLLWNYSLFSGGSHTAQAYANGHAFGAKSTFQVVRIDPDKAFVTGLEAEYNINFQGGLRLVWQQSQQSFVIAGIGSGDTASTTATPTDPAKTAATQGAFEVPGDLSSQSGIIVISGWACEAETVTIEIDGGAHTFAAAYGTERGDTQTVCGHKKTGFGVLWNMNLLGPGQHIAVARVDGEVLGSATFTVTEIDGNDDEENDQDFLTGLIGSFPLTGFPEGETTSTITWTQSTQNFVITQVGPASTPTPTPTPTPSGPHCGDGIVDYFLDEECDGGDLDEETCASIYGGSQDDECGGQLACTSECKLDGTACSCDCTEDFDCLLGSPDSTIVECGPTYCVDEICSEDDLEDCECQLDFDGVCYNGTCLTTPVDPGLLETVCFGVDDDGYARCDWCEAF